MERVQGLENVIRELRTNHERLVPCSEKDVRTIERKFKVSLPPVYLRFLYMMGRSAGTYQRGSSCFYPELLELRDWAEELLLENNFKPLPEDAFVFWMHQGYQFAFFRLSEGDDPPVYYYHEVESKEDFRLDAQHVSDFFIKS